MASGYVKPVKGAVKRLDQGMDFQGKPGDSVVAIGLARVDYVKDDPGGFGKTVYYTLLSGPMRGQQIYVGHAAPAVTQGQIVQAGTPVATLQQHGGGNASNLAGWTEIGFAKGGVPEGRNTAKRFQKFLNTLPNPSVTPAPVQTAPVATDMSMQPQQPDYAVQRVEPPAPETTQPQVMAPGSGPSGLWQQVTSQGGLSPDTQAYAQNVATSAGG